MAKRELTDREKEELKRKIAEEIVTPAVENAVEFVNDSLRNIGVFGKTSHSGESNPYSPKNMKKYLGRNYHR